MQSDGRGIRVIWKEKTGKVNDSLYSKNLNIDVEEHTGLTGQIKTDGYEHTGRIWHNHSGITVHLAKAEVSEDIWKFNDESYCGKTDRKINPRKMKKKGPPLFKKSTLTFTNDRGRKCKKSNLTITNERGRKLCAKAEPILMKFRNSFFRQEISTRQHSKIKNQRNYWNYLEPEIENRIKSEEKTEGNPEYGNNLTSYLCRDSTRLNMNSKENKENGSGNEAIEMEIDQSGSANASSPAGNGQRKRVITSPTESEQVSKRQSKADLVNMSNEEEDDLLNSEDDEETGEETRGAGDSKEFEPNCSPATRKRNREWTEIKRRNLEQERSLAEQKQMFLEMKNQNDRLLQELELSRNIAANRMNQGIENQVNNQPEPQQPQADLMGIPDYRDKNPMDECEDVIVIRHRNYPIQVFHDKIFEEFTEKIQKAIALNNNSINGFVLRYDEVILKQGVIATTCKNVGTVCWLVMTVGSIDEELVCQRLQDANILPAFILWAPDVKSEFTAVIQSIVGDMGKDHWILLKTFQPTREGAVLGRRFLFLGNEELRDDLINQPRNQRFVQYGFSNFKAKVWYIRSIEANQARQEDQRGKNSEILMNNDITLNLFKINQIKRIDRMIRSNRCSAKSKRGSESSTPGVIETTRDCEKGAAQGKGESELGIHVATCCKMNYYIKNELYLVMKYYCKEARTRSLGWWKKIKFEMIWCACKAHNNVPRKISSRLKNGYSGRNKYRNKVIIEEISNTIKVFLAEISNSLGTRGEQFNCSKPSCCKSKTGYHQTKIKDFLVYKVNHSYKRIKLRITTENKAR